MGCSIWSSGKGGFLGKASSALRYNRRAEVWFLQAATTQHLVAKIGNVHDRPTGIRRRVRCVNLASRNGKGEFLGSASSALQYKRPADVSFLEAGTSQYSLAGMAMQWNATCEKVDDS